MNTLLSPATTTEGFGYGNLTFAKKVTVQNEETYEEGKSTNGGAYSYARELYYFHGENPKQGVYGYWKISYDSNSSEFRTDSNGVFCDNLIYRNFGNINGYQLPLFKEQCHQSEPECGQETSANLWEYLSEVTEDEFFFARNCIMYKEEGKRKISWEFKESDGYHQ